MTGRGGRGSMIFDPFRDQDRNRFIPGNLPPGAVPPGILTKKIPT